MNDNNLMIRRPAYGRWPAALLVLVCVWFSSDDSLRADITLSKIFTDHMVLQRHSEVTIWGTAEPKQQLNITFADTKTATTARLDGRWSAMIVTAAAGGPFELTVAAKAGEPKVVLSDVMVGEVWLCSGQSNMEWPTKNALNAETEIELARNYPNLRLFTINHQSAPQPLAEFSKVKSWRRCGSKSVADFSAVGYFFGRELSRNLGDIPIGLINVSWGGTAAEAWISRPSLEAVESLAPLLAHWDEDPAPSRPNRPANLFNGMLAPLTKFKIRGAIWYQGEANNGRGAQYSTLLPTLIQDWRTHFSDESLPFYYVQLAPFRYQNLPSQSLAEIWDSQLRTSQSVPHTGMVVTTDIGEPDDIHPKNKQVVGQRLALYALAKLYADRVPPENQSLIYCGPTLESHVVLGNQIQLTFKDVGEGLRKRDTDRGLEYFQICGVDHVFVPAIARLVGNTVEVSSPEVDQPIAVRFGWDDTANPNLVNSAGLPASPFRTDDFPLESAGRSY